MLSPQRRHRTLGRNRGRQLGRFSHGLGLVFIHGRHESVLQSLARGENAGGETDVFDPGEVADGVGEPRQSANVCGDADVDFFDGESGSGGGDADVAGEAEVEGEAEGYSVEDCYDGFGFTLVKTNPQFFSLLLSFN